MKVRDFIDEAISIDVYDNVCEELGICFEGPMALTAKGAEHFAEVLDYDVEIMQPGSIYMTAIVDVDDEDEKVWEHKLRKAKEFFEAMAGYCAADDYDKWFADA